MGKKGKSFQKIAKETLMEIDKIPSQNYLDNKIHALRTQFRKILPLLSNSYIFTDYQKRKLFNEYEAALIKTFVKHLTYEKGIFYEIHEQCNKGRNNSRTEKLSCSEMCVLMIDVNFEMNRIRTPEKFNTMDDMPKDIMIPLFVQSILSYHNRIIEYAMTLPLDYQFSIFKKINSFLSQTFKELVKGKSTDDVIK